MPSLVPRGFLENTRKKSHKKGTTTSDRLTTQIPCRSILFFFFDWATCRTARLVTGGLVILFIWVAGNSPLDREEGRMREGRQEGKRAHPRYRG